LPLRIKPQALQIPVSLIDEMMMHQNKPEIGSTTALAAREIAGSFHRTFRPPTMHPKQSSLRLVSGVCTNAGRHQRTKTPKPDRFKPTLRRGPGSHACNIANNLAQRDQLRPSHKAQGPHVVRELNGLPMFFPVLVEDVLAFEHAKLARVLF
jgi:hypothetical protein